MLISIGRTGENQLKPGQESIRDTAVLSDCSLLRNPSPNPSGVLEHYRKEETNTRLSIFRGVFF
jgi:hypothetical protein